jgi:GT2 family glycosyltransferase
VELRDEPAVSAVIVATRDRAALDTRIADVAAKAARHEAEIVIVRPAALGDVEAIAAAFPSARVVACPADSHAPLRAYGVAASTGAVIVLTDDDSHAGPEWLDFERVTPGGDRRPEGTRPALSVVVPAHQAETILDVTLGALERSDLPRASWELVVVDDASTDGTELVAAAYADVLVRLAGNPHGPAYARNRGTEVCRGEVIAFVDADVTVHPDALRRITSHLSGPSDWSAVFGSYDVNPSHTSLASQYRNLLHHFVHQRNAGPAETFWSGLGAVRASVFVDIGMFDEWHYSRPQIEDIELGRRLRAEGHALLLDPAIQGTHLKRWTFRNILATDFQHRGVPWMWLLLQEGATAERQGLNVGRMEQLCTALVALGALLLGTAAVICAVWPLPLAGGAVALAGALNLPFYRYLRRRRSLLFTLGALPLHLSYYVTNVLAVGTGWLVYQLFGTPMPPPERQAAAQVGLKSWPPPIRRPRRSTWNGRRAATPRLPPSAPAPAADTGPTDAPAPAEPVSLGVVVASCRPRALLDACLAALVPQCARHHAPLVVARAGSDADLATLRQHWPDVRFLPAPAGSTIPELRGIGLAEAAGALVAVTEDHCIPGPDWLARLAAAPADRDVVGGAMGNARRDRAVDWAAYFSDYGFFAASRPAAGPPAITGANVAYRRSVIPRVAALARTGEWENVVHDCLRAAGNTLTFLPEAVVLQNDTYRFVDFYRNRFRHGRDYARRRLVDEPRYRRWVLLAGTPVLPVLLTARVAGMAARVDRAAFARALPVTFLFLSAWAVGEAVGYWLGPPRGRPDPATGAHRPAPAR